MLQLNRGIFVVLFVLLVLPAGCASTSSIFPQGGSHEQSGQLSEKSQLENVPSQATLGLKEEIISLAEHIKKRESELVDMHVTKQEQLPAGMKKIKYYLDKAASAVDGADYPYLDKSQLRKDISAIADQVGKVIDLETQSK